MRFWRPFFSFVFESVLFWYHIIITSFWFRDPLKQAADQRSITFSCFFFIFTLFWTVAEHLGGNRECHQGWNSNWCPKVSFQEFCLFFNITISLAPSVNTFQNILATKCEYFLQYHWLQVSVSTTWYSFYDITWSKCGYFLYMCEASPGSPHRSQLNNPCPASDVQPVAAPIMRNTKFPSREIEKQLAWEKQK